MSDVQKAAGWIGTPPPVSRRSGGRDGRPETR
jgi:hypothetical protein